MSLVACAPEHAAASRDWRGYAVVVGSSLTAPLGHRVSAVALVSPAVGGFVAMLYMRR